MDTLDGEGGVRDYNLERLIMLSDGVFAIALTLLALELKTPADWDGSAVGLINGMWRELMAFAISFVAIAFYWAGHRRSFKRFLRADGMLTALNFLLLGLVTLVPIMTRMMIGHGPGGDTLAIYIGLISSIGVATALMWGYAAFVGKIIDPKMPFRMRFGVLLIQLLAPTAMASMGVIGGMYGQAWIWIVMIGFAVLIAVTRKIIGKGYDS